MPHITPSRPQSRTSRGRAPVPKVHARDFFAKTRTFDALASSAIADCIRENRLFAKKTHRDVTVDGNGNVRALVKADAANPAASAVAEKYNYDGFGRELPFSLSSNVQGLNSFRFSTKYFDTEVGLNYYGYRFYAADAGRWINRDPIAEKGGLNINAFCNNSAVGLIDRLGNLTLTVSVAIEPSYVTNFGRTFNGGLKLFQQAEFDEDMSAGCKLKSNYTYVGETIEYDTSKLPSLVEINRGHSSDSKAYASSTAYKSDCKCVFSISGYGSNPLVSGAPGIDYSARVELDFKAKKFKATFVHDGFPSYTFTGIGAGYYYSHVNAGTTPASLFPPVDTSWHEEGSL